MNPQLTIIIAVAGIALVMFAFIAIFLSRYAKAGPNQVLIISGRQHQLPDGTRVGFRIVKGGGTFVFPVVERKDVLSLEVLTIEMPGLKAWTANELPVVVDSVAQVKIKDDDASILAAIRHFLSKSEGDIKIVVKLVLEKHLQGIHCSTSSEGVAQYPAAYAARVQTAASVDLDSMGLGVVSFTVRNIHAG